MSDHEGEWNGGEQVGMEARAECFDSSMIVWVPLLAYGTRKCSFR